ncbi:unnamed protein product [Spirodela intermedia]|uniref:Uncharacterized protein n=1 Tax=Spirodela intermedia TaxID=51605 RepID=A0A7I8IDL9_SPIIN|nr:unnamed protein product [Spirodela intermedia]CAA6655917.1 unnamed protein product [Spirodela intermedia]
MDRRSWPWRKKRSEKTAPTNASPNASSDVSAGNQRDQPNSKVVDYIQISKERYANLTESEDQVKALNDEVRELNEKLSAAQTELLSKDNLVNQHAKVAEEAVSGWEKAEAEALALKNQLESVTLLKLTAEERASHLDGALKECMKQIRTVKEEGEQKLRDVVLAKTVQWEKIKFELESKIAEFEQGLLNASAESAALSRSLQERSHMLMKLSEEKSQADEEIEVLKASIQSLDKEISSLKYEAQVVSKELEIRNEEKNMSQRSAEVASRQHLEDVKKITKLEAECQRLRGLVRKKLPGAAALAQMKHEVDGLGHDYGETRLRRSPGKSASPRRGPSSDYGTPRFGPHDFALENIQQCHKENELLTARLLAMEEETKLLKEALSKRNSELQASRSISQALSLDPPVEGSLIRNGSDPPSLTSISEDGIDEDGSHSDYWAAVLAPDLSRKKDKDAYKSSQVQDADPLDLMNDFLEMEKLAWLSTESNGGQFNGKQSSTELQSERNQVFLSRIKTRIALAFKDQSDKLDVAKLLDDIKTILHSMEEELSLGSTADETIGNGISVACNGNSLPDSKVSEDQDLRTAISHIQDFVASLWSKTKGTTRTAWGFSDCVSKVLSNEIGFDSFIIALSISLYETKKSLFHMLGDGKNEGDCSSADCIDKVTLLENNVEPGNHCDRLPTPDSYPDMNCHNGDASPAFELEHTVAKISTEEFEQLKLERDVLKVELSGCSQSLEQTKIQLHEMEQQAAELKSQLAASHKSNSLAETQLKCMAESYKSLEARAQKLETEISRLREKIEMLDDELQQERVSHQDDLAKWRELQEQLERNQKSEHSLTSDADIETKMKQEREIAAATEKLAECQETISLLGRQLRSLHAPKEPPGSSRTADFRGMKISSKTSRQHPQFSDRVDLDGMASFLQRAGGESPVGGFNPLFSPPRSEAGGSFPMSPVSAKKSNHRSSSSFSNNPAPERHGRGFSRFFSKGKNAH